MNLTNDNNCIIIQLIGGLGNQMFQLALYSKLIYLKKNAFVDSIILNSYLSSRKWKSVLDVFDYKPNYASRKDIEKYGDLSNTLFSQARRKLIGKKKTHIEENKEGNYEPEILDLENAYLVGYWQSYKYFEDCPERIHDMFRFPTSISPKSKEYLKLIKDSKPSVSLHLRRGDYTVGGNVNIYGGICTEEYYAKAINLMEQKYPGCTFFIFSNDPEYASRYYNKDNYILVNCNDEGNAWQDMYLMTQCDHNIIANSSFSWWGAWLNQNPDKMVIAPKKWINTIEMKDICPDEWIRI